MARLALTRLSCTATLRQPSSTPAAGVPAVVLALLVATLLTACSKPEPQAPDARPTVAGETVSFPDNQDPPSLRMATVAAAADHTVMLPGRLAWDEDHTSRVYAPYAGRIEALMATVGQHVQRGQALARISSADIGQAQADLHKAEADQALGRSNVARARDLTEAGVIARKDLEQAEADLARSSAEDSRARARLSQYGVAAGAVNQSLTLTTPISGLVVDRNSNLGAEVRADVQGSALFTISEPAMLWAQIDVDESQLALLKPGQAIKLATVAWPDQRFDATVLSIGAAVDPASRTVKVRARVANPDGRLKAEMFVSAEVAAASGGLPQVPADAVFLRGERSAAFVQKGAGHFERRAVQVRAAGPSAWQVVSGLAVGERVVVGGALYLNQLLDATK